MRTLFFLLSLLWISGLSAQQRDSRTREYLPPVRIVWQQDSALIRGSENLLQPGNGQSDLSNLKICKMSSTDQSHPAILLDFGRELQGGLQLVTGMPESHEPIAVRIRFGESASEAMCEIDGANGATNDHAMRDFVIRLPWLGVLEVGNTGFRFVRIDLVDDSAELCLKEIRAISTFRDIPYRGSFRCNDERLNEIWRTGAYTVHLNMQEYLWDGVKRDRLVWVGDLHPEVMTVNSVFGYNEVVPKSLDLARDITPLPGWMNGISSYSIWWLLIQRDWYYYQGDLDYLENQKAYLTALLRHLISKVGEDGVERLDGNRFLDWPSNANPAAINAGLQALMVRAMKAGSELCEVLLSGLMDPVEADRRYLSVNGAKGFSTFYGYYMLRAMAAAGNYEGALDRIRQYWGAMLDLGATTFWEDFDLDWLPGAAPIDELVPAGMRDIHGEFGAYCYKGFRHSLCHGWASGPTSWLSEYVLGIQVVEPGCRVVRIEPHLGDLTWVEGTFPTPYGEIKVRHEKGEDGEVRSHVNAPDEITILGVDD